MGAEDEDYVAVVVVFDGPDGSVAIDEQYLMTGQQKSKNGQRLYFTTSATILGGAPEVKFIYTT